MSRRAGGRLGLAVTVSAVLHGVAIVLFWATASRAEPLPEMRVYAVDLVSPPPQQQGEWSPEPVVPPDPTPQPEPEEPEPEPEPPPPEPEPAPAPPAKKKPAPEKPKPAPEKPRETPPAKAEPSKEPAREAPKPRASTGQDPDPSSPGGEALNVKLDGLRCFEPGYCENIIRQVSRYFRRPAGVGAAEADVYFVINHDGSASEIQVISHTGGFAFRLAVIEAVEQAGLNRAFGELPDAFGDRLPVRFTFRPAR